jgi:simple sugar transport system permease protein
MADILSSGLISVVAAGTPLILAASGELVAEKSGVLNLGIEGMMLVGAISAFSVAHNTGNLPLAVLCALIAGMLMALIFGFLSLTMQANQTATGLALTIFGRGLSALVGAGYVGIAAPTLPSLNIPVLSDLPFIGRVVFSYDVLVYFAFILLGGVAIFLNRTRWGLIVRAVGDAQDAAHAIGYRVITIRYAATLFGGATAGLAGAYMSLSYSPLWAQDMTAGRGWVALALVVFAAWRPFWVLIGAWFFGALMYLSLYVQGIGIPIPSPFVAALPYLGTVVVLVLISRDRRRIRLHRPAMLGRSFRQTV